MAMKMSFARVRFRILAICFISASVLSARPRVDERGNPITEVIKNEKVNPSQKASSLQDVNAAKADGLTPNDKNPPQTEAKPANEEIVITKNPLTKVYLEQAKLHLDSDRETKGRELLRKSIESGDDTYSREARLRLVYLQAAAGEVNVLSEIEGVDEKLRSQAMLRAADGFQSCAHNFPAKKECSEKAEEAYSHLANLENNSPETALAKMRLAFLLLVEHREEAALPHLISALESAQNLGQATATTIPWDRAWFQLGELYLKPGTLRDPYKARIAFKQVLKVSGSPYAQIARQKLALIDRY